MPLPSSFDEAVELVADFEDVALDVEFDEVDSSSSSSEFNKLDNVSLLLSCFPEVALDVVEEESDNPRSLSICAEVEAEEVDPEEEVVSELVPNKASISVVEVLSEAAVCAKTF
jgi:hypothetical protein